MGNDVVPFPSPPRVITQEELIALRILKLRVKKALHEYQTLRTHVREALEEGAQVEPGLHSVRLHGRIILD
jgi:hypothetical protein